MKRTITTTLTALLLATGSTASAGHAFIDFDDAGNMVISGPFNAIIPKPEGARMGGPEHSAASFLDENLKVSKAGYFGDDQFVEAGVADFVILKKGRDDPDDLTPGVDGGVGDEAHQADPTAAINEGAAALGQESPEGRGG